VPTRHIARCRDGASLRAVSCDERQRRDQPSCRNRLAGPTGKPFEEGFEQLTPVNRDPARPQAINLDSLVALGGGRAHQAYNFLILGLPALLWPSSGVRRIRASLAKPCVTAQAYGSSSMLPLAANIAKARRPRLRLQRAPVRSESLPGGLASLRGLRIVLVRGSFCADNRQSRCQVGRNLSSAVACCGPNVAQAEIRFRLACNAFMTVLGTLDRRGGRWTSRIEDY